MQEVFREAVACFQSGRLAEAEGLCRKVLAALPDQPDTLHLMGLIAHLDARDEEAEGLIAKALAITGDQPEYMKNLGFILDRLGKAGEAEALLQRAARLAPGDPEVQNNLGIALESLERLEEAEQAYGRAVELAPDHANAWANLGTVRQKSGRLEAAGEAFRRAIALAPDFAEAHGNLGNILKELGELDDAVASYHRAIDFKPDYAEAFSNLGVALEEQKKLDESVASLEKAIALRPDYADAHGNLAATLQHLGRLEEAVACCDKAIALDPACYQAHHNLGNLRVETGHLEEGLECFARAIAIQPDYAEAQTDRALALLSAGHFAEGLAGYEWRWKRAQLPTPWRDFPQAPWDGGPLKDGRLAIWSEQGIGDQLLYGGLIPKVLAAGIECIVECDPRLVGLLARAFPATEVVAYRDPPDPKLMCEDIAAQIPLASLPGRLGPWPEGLRLARRFLVPDLQRRADCARKLDALGSRPRIGIAWRSARHKMGPKKSMPLELWDPILAGRNALFVNLQYGETEEEVSEAVGRTGGEIYTDPDVDRFQDLEGMMALVDCLDLVITTSNVTAHYAGALGKPCWLALQVAPLWYWGLTGSGTLFYPSVKAYRQIRADDWHPVMVALASDLDASG